MSPMQEERFESTYPCKSSLPYYKHIDRSFKTHAAFKSGGNLSQTPSKCGFSDAFWGHLHLAFNVKSH